MRISTLLLLSLLWVLAACTQPDPTPPSTTAGQPSADLSQVKQYLLEKAQALKSNTMALRQASDRYYTLAQAVNFDYAALWSTKPDDVRQALQAAKTAWIAASPHYEQMEGIVAGTSALAQFDRDMDAGSSGAAGDDNIVSFDLKLPDGRVLPKPGNLFGLTEGTLWGSNPEYAVATVEPDLNEDGKIEFGEVLPDANFLKGSADLLDAKAGELHSAAASWQPTAAEAFGALIGNMPTVGDFFESWKNSRFVTTDLTQASQDFVVISRLSDIVDNITSWQAIYAGLSAEVSHVDQPTDQEIQQRLSDLKTYVTAIYAKEQNGKRYTPEEADLLSTEAQSRATALVGLVTQVAARLDIALK